MPAGLTWPLTAVYRTDGRLGGVQGEVVAAQAAPGAGLARDGTGTLCPQRRGRSRRDLWTRRFALAWPVQAPGGAGSGLVLPCRPASAASPAWPDGGGR